MITSKNLIEYAETGVDFISMGSLSYDAKNIDMSLKAIIYR
jgi:nicotinate-nucleotide pyrophosphorylase